jgi:hypothetical protein
MTIAFLVSSVAAVIAVCAIALWFDAPASE